MSSEVLYQMSPFLHIFPPQQGAARTRVLNQLSGKYFELGLKAVDCLRYFRQPRTFGQMEEELDIQGAMADGLLNTFLAGKLLFPQGEEGLFTQAITQPAPPMFGLNEGVLRRDQPGAVRVKKWGIVGVPFARGNDISLGSASFPDHLRSKTNYLQLNANAAELLNFSFLDARYEYSRLQRYLRNGEISDLGNMYIDHGESVNFIYEKIEAIAGGLFRDKMRPLFIGGDHSITFPIVRSAAAHFGSLTILHFDAHADMSYHKYDKVRHSGCVSHTHSNVIGKCLELDGVKSVFQIGLRGFSNRFEFDSPRRKIIWMEEARQRIQQKDWDLGIDGPCYITIDIDVLDPSVSPGTGSPCAGGFWPEELRTMLYALAEGLDIVGADIVEADPSRDVMGSSTQIAAELLLHLFNALPYAKDENC